MTSSTLVKIGASAVGVALATRLMSRKRFDLKERVVLITGGSRGLGLVMAREFQSRGARIAICARDAEELLRAQIDLEKTGADVLAVQCDVTNNSQVQEMVSQVLERYGHI